MTNQGTENIKAKGLATITIINSNATSYATRVLNKGQGNVLRQNIEYTSKALSAVQKNLAFTTPKQSLMDYYFYQRLGVLKADTSNKLLVGIDGTLV